MKHKAAVVAISVVRSAFAGAWSYVMESIDTEDREIREKMFRIETFLQEIEFYLRRKSD